MLFYIGTCARWSETLRSNLRAARGKRGGMRAVRPLSAPARTVVREHVSANFTLRVCTQRAVQCGFDKIELLQPSSVQHCCRALRERGRSVVQKEGKEEETKLTNVMSFL